MGVTEHMEYQWRKNKVQRESLKHKVWQKKANTEITQVQKQGGEEFSQTRQTRNNINRCAEEDKKKAQRGDLIKVYRITKELSGKANQVPPVKSSSGKIITTEKKQSAWWVENLKNVLNRSEADLAFEGTEQQDELHINTNSPSKD